MIGTQGTTRRAEGIQPTRVAFQAVDSDRFQRPVVTGRVQLATSGPVEVVGDRDFGSSRAMITVTPGALNAPNVAVQLLQPARTLTPSSDNSPRRQ